MRWTSLFQPDASLITHPHICLPNFFLPDDSKHSSFLDRWRRRRLFLLTPPPTLLSTCIRALESGDQEVLSYSLSRGIATITQSANHEIGPKYKTDYLCDLRLCVGSVYRASMRWRGAKGNGDIHIANFLSRFLESCIWSVPGRFWRGFLALGIGELVVLFNDLRFQFFVLLCSLLYYFCFFL